MRCVNYRRGRTFGDRYSGVNSLGLTVKRGNSVWNRAESRRKIRSRIRLIGVSRRISIARNCIRDTALSRFLSSPRFSTLTFTRACESSENCDELTRVNLLQDAVKSNRLAAGESFRTARVVSCRVIRRSIHEIQTTAANEAKGDERTDDARRLLRSISSSHQARRKLTSVGAK